MAAFLNTEYQRCAGWNAHALSRPASKDEKESLVTTKVLNGMCVQLQRWWRRFSRPHPRRTNGKAKNDMEPKHRRGFKKTPCQQELRNSAQESGGMEEDNGGRVNPPWIVAKNRRSASLFPTRFIASTLPQALRHHYRHQTNIRTYIEMNYWTQYKAIKRRCVRNCLSYDDDCSLQFRLFFCASYSRHIFNILFIAAFSSPFARQSPDRTHFPRRMHPELCENSKKKRMRDCTSLWKQSVKNGCASEWKRERRRRIFCSRKIISAKPNNAYRRLSAIV